MSRPKAFRLTAPIVRLSENDVERQCRDLLPRRGYKPVRLQSGLFIPADRAVVEALQRAGVPFRRVTIGEPGLPDYAVLKRDFFLEVKAPNGQLSKEQQLKILELEQGWGIKVAVIDSVEALAAWLEHHERSP